MATDSAESYIKHITKGVAKHLEERDFAEIDRRVLAEMSDKDLALWQSRHAQDSPHFILAQFEWSRRLTVEQVNSTRWAAWVGIVAGLGGTVVGALLNHFLK